jgi:hypothetical protein
MTSSEALAHLTAELAAHSHLSRRDWYRTVYLRSKHWRKLKRQAKNHHGRQCRHCRCLRRLDVHHLNYRNIFDVTVEDLEILCRKCHQKEHGSTPVVTVTTTPPNYGKRAKKKFKARRNKRTGVIHTLPPARVGPGVSKQDLAKQKIRREAARGM